MKNLSFVLSLSFLLALVSGCNQSACTDVNCLNGGECNHGECVCPEGFSGEYCENVGEDPCENLVCLNGGTCVDGSCLCPEGYSGDNCENASSGPCENVNCLNGGVCVDGSCVCPEGFSGPNCETSVASSFLGTYSVSESCTSSPSIAYTITITQGNIGDQVVINNFRNLNIEVIGVVSDNSMSIPSQTIDQVTYNGAAYLQGSVIEGNYSVSYTGGGESCSMTCIRQ